ncbi:MAG: UDP-N-acetylmuramoyl-L-alanyl-D-glutamate--2,6-diaminopimelate ligase, partial [Desulfobulbaceae bacterium]|nr:UDP-N-acetylmuramoyl-L-alanyl-D-glutamate--2,6-diaminopimelate ligase [Desulfobulbaceae bacterium]
MKTLNELLSAVTVVSRSGRLSALDQKIRGLTSDSRKVEKGTVFVALEGTDQDGHRFVMDACARGCIAVVIENDIEVPANTPVFQVKDSHRAYGQMAAEFYGHPGREMTVIGLTGTNGKTTTSWIIERMLKEAGKKTGVIGTVNYRFTGPEGRDVVRDASLTTPEPLELQQLLREMADSGVTDVIIEVSSHALAQQRLAGLLFDVGVFTNLSRDHLDYHHSMEEYFDSKCRLFLEFLKNEGIAVVVVDSVPQGKKGLHVDWNRRLVLLLQKNGFLRFGEGRKNRSYITCGFDRSCIVSAHEPVQSITGFASRIFMRGRSLNLKSRLIGRHNALNMLAAAGAGLGTGMKMEAVTLGLCGVDRIPGRLERVALPPYGAGNNGPYVFVDYAHTPDALENVLRTLRQVTSGRLICIFGCGGNRDRGKRILMGKVAGRLADRILVTSDNPRKEDPLTILMEIEQGLRQIGVDKTDVSRLLDKETAEPEYAVLEDRRQAIHTICALAESTDVVLIAGKGHETYQIT